MFAQRTTLLVILPLLAVSFPSSLCAQDPRWKTFTEMHEFYTEIFERHPGFGPSRIASTKQVAVFKEEAQRMNTASALLVRQEPFAVVNQSLIGLDRESAVVYQSNDSKMMQRDGIESYATRELTEFEVKAVEALRKGKKVAHQSNQDKSQYTVIGALRAKQSCAECHSVPENTLLGAFVFTLDRIVSKPSQNVMPASQLTQRKRKVQSQAFQN